MNEMPTLLGHVLERLGQVLLAKGQLSNSPNLSVLECISSLQYLDHKMRGETITHRLQVLLQLRVQSTGLEGNDLRSSIGVMSNGGAALGAEKAMDVFPRGAFAGPFLDGAFDGELVFGDDGDEGCSLVSEDLKRGIVRRKTGLRIRVDCGNRHVQ